MITAEQCERFIAWLLWYELAADAERGLDPVIRREVVVSFRRFRRWAIRMTKMEE